MRSILALDQGTTSSRAIVFDEDGSVRAIAQKEFRQFFPRSGWVEHNPEEIWASQLAVAREALGRANLRAEDVAAIGITNQRETVIAWDRRSGKPVCNAIVWQDRRTADFCDELKRQGHAKQIAERTGLVIDAYFSASKIRWILDHEDGGLRDMATQGDLQFGTVDSWLIWKLTGGGVYATDVTNASRTMLFNLQTGDWDEELCELLGIPAPRWTLPRICNSSEIIGHTDPALFGAGIPIAGVAGDQQAALFGQACFTRGLAKNTYGTGCFMLMNLGEEPLPSNHQLITTVAWKLAQQPKMTYAMEGSVFIGGAVVQWLRDGLGIIKSAAEIEALARTVPDSGGVYLVPAFAGLGAPHWDQYARGTITGLTRGTTAAHFARAALEGIAFQVADVLDVMKQDTRIAIPELRVDGGAAANDLLMQFQADLLGVPVVRPLVLETTALGAAYLAGLAVGFWTSPEELQSHRVVERTFEPAMSADEVHHRRTRWNEALRRAREWETSPRHFST